MIPFLDMKAQHEAIAAEVRAAIDGVFDRGQFILGPEVAAFEEEFASYVGVRHAIGVASGTDALHLALRACDIGSGDEVITVPHTAVATVAAIELAGARPVFVDIHPDSYTLDPRLLEAAVTLRTKAILPVHLYGQAAPLAPILEIAKVHGLQIIEDACQAHGALYHPSTGSGQGERKVGAWGDIGCFSFYPTKNLGAYGDVGMVVTDDAALAERVRLLRTYGWAERDRSIIRGVNSRLDEVQAAILRVKLKHLDAWNDRRRALAACYAAALGDLSGVILPGEIPYGRHVYHLYVVRLPIGQAGGRDRDGLRRFLAEQGIGTMVHYPTPIHLQEAYRDLGYPEGSLPESERAAREIISLPLSPQLTETQVETIAHAIRAYLGRV